MDKPSPPKEIKKTPSSTTPTRSKPNLPKGNLRLLICFGVGAGMLLIFVIIMVSLCSSRQTELDSQKESESSMRASLATLTAKVRKQSMDIYNMQSQLNASKNTTDTYKALWKTLNDTASSQAMTIASLQTANKWLMIGGGTALGLALAGTGGAIYEYFAILKLDPLILALKAELEEGIKKYAKYFEQTKYLLMDTYTYLYPIPIPNVIYDSNANFSRTAFYDSVKGKSNTVTLIMTDTGDIMATYLMSEWRAEDGEIMDHNALTISLYRFDYAMIKNEAASRAVVVSPQTFLQFGDNEIVVYNNHTGMAVANRSFTPSSPPSNWTNETFYAPSPRFKVSRIQVLLYL